MNTGKVGLRKLGDYRSVMIVKPSSLGDIVHTLPAVAQLRRAMPQAVFRWVMNTEWVPLVEGGGVVDEVIPFPRRTFRGVMGALRAWLWMRRWGQWPREQPELLVDFQGLLRSGLLARTRRAEWVVGLSDAREGAGWFHQQVVPVEVAGHAVDRYLAVVEAMGVRPSEARFPLAEGSCPEGWPGGDDWLVVHPFSRGAGKSLEGAELAALLSELAPRKVVLVGVTKTALEGAWPHVVDLTNRTTLPELIWCLRQARGVVSVDSGPMHLAAAVNPNVVGIHAWTDPRKVGPYPAAAWVWKAGRIAHRSDLTATECANEARMDGDAARELARWLKVNWP
jgi:heptosyltransferase-1